MLRLTTLTAVILFFSSCADQSKKEQTKNVLAVFKATEQGLALSNQTITFSNEELYKLAGQRMQDPRNVEYTSKWQPKLMAIRELSNDLTAYIEKLKTDLKLAAGKSADPNEQFHEDNVGAVTRLIDKNGKGKELYDRLEKYESDMLATDPEIKETFKNSFISVTNEFSGNVERQQSFTKTYFDHMPAIAALALLSRFENDAKVMENQLVHFCQAKTSPVMYIDDFNIRPLISQNSTNLLPGQELEITAGIGNYSTAVKPIISINGAFIKTGEDGTVSYALIAPPKAGTYSVPVVIQYTKPDGTSATVKKTLEFMVGMPKMN